jgi:hypothetical protein
MDEETHEQIRRTLEELSEELSKLCDAIGIETPTEQSHHNPPIIP